MRHRILMLVAIIGVLALSVVLVGGCRPQAGAADPAEFYKGKTVTLAVASAAGTGTDLTARALAPVLANQLGATVVVDNMVTGTTMEGLNYVYDKAKPDGLTLGVTPTISALLNDMLGAPGIRYKSESLNWLGFYTPGIPVLAVSSQKPFQSVKDLQQAKGLKFGGGSISGAPTLRCTVVMSILNLDGKVIAGLAGSPAILLSIQKGELDGAAFPDDTVVAYEKKGQVRALFYLYSKGQEYPNLPRLADLVKLTKEQESLLAAVSDTYDGVATSPGVPKERVEFLEKVFRKIGEDKSLQQALMKSMMLDSWPGFMTGADGQKTFMEIKTNQAILEKLKETIEKYRA